MTIIETEEGLHDLEVDLTELGNIVLQQGQTRLILDQKVARTLAHVIIGMTRTLCGKDKSE
jgi:hypothetical protein